MTVVDYFLSLITIDSESLNEKEVALKIKSDFEALGAKVEFDNANEKTGGNVGNFYAYFDGNIKKDPILFCAHLDTVKPGNGIKPVIEDGIIKSDGTTILGSDDKSGIAEIYWGIKEIIEEDKDHAPIEVLFTISEEIGLLGAKYTDYSKLKSKIGYALDSHHVGEFVCGAPSQNSVCFEIHGKKAHAGAEPENGVNAIAIAAEAISKMTLGRIDEETTCSIGIIKGGVATNIVPDYVKMNGEARSHNVEKLEKVTESMVKAIEETVAGYSLGDWKATADIHIEREYDAFFMQDNEEVVDIAVKAAGEIGLKPKTVKGGGGSDANIINKHGIKMIICGSGMDKVHTTEEQIKVSELEYGYKWVKKLIENYR